MPPVEGCAKQDYAVLIVIGMGLEVPPKERAMDDD